jgi:hypothetical protein
VYPSGIHFVAHMLIGSYSFPLILFTSVGSENKNNGNAKLMNPFFTDSISVYP